MSTQRELGQVTIPSLKESLSELEDPRKAKGLRHPLVSLLCLCCVAMMSGAKNPQGIEDWWKDRQDLGPFLSQLGFPHDYGPSRSTIYRVLGLVTVEAFERVLSNWIETVMSVIEPAQEDELEGISVDGKTLRGSKKQGAEKTHLLSALSHRLGITVSQMGVDDKTNEIGQMADFLAEIVITGRVFTMDALLTQVEIAQTIIDEGGDYVMIVKENQPTLKADIELLFAEPGAEEFIDDQVTTINKGHGRLEYRTLKSSTALNEFTSWPGTQQVFSLERKTIILNTGEVRGETVYGISSLSRERANASQLLDINRQHWSIENRSHWPRDVTFGEDLSQVRVARLPQMMAALRNTTIALIRLSGFKSIPRAFNFFAARPAEALQAIGC